MKSFEELEEQHKRTPVHTDGASGVLVLAREQTEVVLSSPQLPHHASDGNGWFDLRLHANNGEVILLHNALSVKKISHWRAEGTTWLEEKIFPNVVVCGAQHIPDNGIISSVSFSNKLFKMFFYYNYVEWVPVHKASKEDLHVLKKMRVKEKKSSKFFRPTDMHIVHQAPNPLIKFQVQDRIYSVFSSRSCSGLSGGQVEIHTQPVANIKFSMPVKIDEAVERIWEWKKFFEQIALQPVNIDTISVRSKKNPPHHSADIYMPNVSPEKTKVHPGDVPLNRWSDRKQLAEAMQKWLSKENERRLFRGAISRVIDRSRKRVAIDDIITLCAGIEGLSELEEKSEISSDQIELLSNAARFAAAEQGMEIDPNRIKGVLNLLRHQSLPRRLKLLVRKLRPDILLKDGELVINVVLDLRKIAAHGQEFAEVTLPRVAPAVEALLGFCVLYDLTTCSVPVKANEQNHIIAIQRVRQAINELRQLKSQQ